MPTRQFKIVDVLTKSFSIYGRNFVSFSVLALLVNLPAIHFIQDNAMSLRAGVLPAPQVWASLSGVISTSILGAALTYGSIMEMRGRHAGIWQCVRVGLVRAIPVLAVALLVGLAAGLPALLVGMPGAFIGIFVMIILYVAIPAAVVENSGVIASLKRSAGLTAGFRWHILGLLLLLGALALMGGMSIQEILLDLAEPSLYVGAAFLMQVAVSIMSAVMAAVSYNELRTIKEATPLGSLATAQVVSE